MGAGGQQLKKFVSNLLRIQPGEARKTSLMFGVMMCVVGTFIVGRVARDSLFLSRYPVDYLPFMYIWVALGVSVQSYLYSRVADRFRRDRIFIATMALMAVLFLASRISLYWVGDWFYPVLYVLVELVGSLMIIQAWTMANEVFTSREAKRLFGLVGAGGVVSSVVVGFTIRGAIKYIATEDLLFLCAFSLGVGIVLVHRLSKACREELLVNLTSSRKEIRARMSLLPDFRRIFTNRHLIFVAGLLSVLVFVMTLVDYQFKVTARAAYLGDEGKLAGFFGLFYGLTGVLNVFIQMLATSRILERFGILVSLLLLPMSLLVGAVSWLIAPVLWSASLLKGSDATLRYTVNDATVQLLYLPVPSYMRGRAKAFIDGIIRPLSIGLAGLGLAWVLPSLPGSALGWVLIGLLAIWMLFAVLVRREYLTSLVATLRKRRLDFDQESSLVPDQAANQALLEALADEDKTNLLHALDMIPYTSGKDWGEALVKLLDHPAAEVRVRAIKLLGEQGALQHGPVVFSCLRDPDPDVLAAAVDAYCSIGKERAVRTIAGFLEHEDADVRSAAVVGLIRYGGLDGVLSSAERLKALLESEAPEERAAGAQILGKIQVKNFYHPLLELMTDEALEVKLAAIRAAGMMKSPELLPALIYRLETPETRLAATEALVKAGGQVVPLLVRVLANARETIDTRLTVPTILARIGDQSAQDALMAQISNPNDQLRTRILDGVHRLRLHRPHLKLDRPLVRKAIEIELRCLYELSFLLSDLDLPDRSLLDDALEQRRKVCLKRIFRLLGCLYNVRSVDAVYNNLASTQARTRSNALEVLDNLLEKEVKHLLLPPLDPSLQSDLFEIGAETFGLENRSRSERLGALVENEDRWLAACAIHEAGLRGEHHLVDELLVQTAAEDPLLRETALVALAKLQVEDAFKRTAQRHLRDPASSVRDMAAFLLARAQPA